VSGRNAPKLEETQMVRMLMTINISKGFKVWSEMAKSLEPEMNKVGAKMIWAGANPDESAVFVVMEMQDPAQIKTFGERPDIAKRREEAGADVSSTTMISPIGDHFTG
jgi:hypothetical protein